MFKKSLYSMNFSEVCYTEMAKVGIASFAFCMIDFYQLNFVVCVSVRVRALARVCVLVIY